MIMVTRRKSQLPAISRWFFCTSSVRKVSSARCRYIRAYSYLSRTRGGYSYWNCSPYLCPRSWGFSRMGSHNKSYILLPFLKSRTAASYNILKWVEHYVRYENTRLLYRMPILILGVCIICDNNRRWDIGGREQGEREEDSGSIWGRIRSANKPHCEVRLTIIRRRCMLGSTWQRGQHLSTNLLINQKCDMQNREIIPSASIVNLGLDLC